VHESHRVRVLQLPVQARRKRIQSGGTAGRSAGEECCSVLQQRRSGGHIHCTPPKRARIFGNIDVGTIGFGSVASVQSCILEVLGSVGFLAGHRLPCGLFRFRQALQAHAGTTIPPTRPPVLLYALHLSLWITGSTGLFTPSAPSRSLSATCRLHMSPAS
jgi:hypothetical protein